MDPSQPVKPASRSTSSQAASKTQRGHPDPVLDAMRRYNLPMTRQAYRNLSDAGGMDEDQMQDWMAELEQDPEYADLPES